MTHTSTRTKTTYPSRFHIDFTMLHVFKKSLKYNQSLPLFPGSKGTPGSMLISPWLPQNISSCFLFCWQTLLCPSLSSLRATWKSTASPCLGAVLFLIPSTVHTHLILSLWDTNISTRCWSDTHTPDISVFTPIPRIYVPWRESMTWVSLRSSILSCDSGPRCRWFSFSSTFSKQPEAIPSPSPMQGLCYYETCSETCKGGGEGEEREDGDF